jgi:hypothetical protein
MNSLRAAGAVMLMMTLVAAAAGLVSSHCLAAAASGAALSLPWLISLALTNWFTRWEIPLAVAAPALAALAAALLSRPSTPAQERRVLLSWLLLAVVLGGADAALLATYLWSPSDAPAFWRAQLLLFPFSLVCAVASVVVAVHLYWRVRRPGSRVRAWHLVAVSIPLALLGPAALLTPLGVWVYAGRVQQGASDAKA